MKPTKVKVKLKAYASLPHVYQFNSLLVSALVETRLVDIYQGHFTWIEHRLLEALVLSSKGFDISGSWRRTSLNVSANFKLLKAASLSKNQVNIYFPVNWFRT